MNTEDLREYLGKFLRAHVLCIGDIMIDHFVSGAVRQLSEEAPVPVLEFENRKSVLGGVGNVLRTLANLGAQSYLVSIVGEDSAAAVLECLLKELPGKHLEEGRIKLIRNELRSTTEVTRFISGKQHFLRLDQHSTQDITKALESKLLEAVCQLMPNIDAIIISDYQKGVLTSALVKSLISQARIHGKKVLIDPVRSKSYDQYNGADVLKPNRFELSAITGNMAVETDSEVIQAVQKLSNSVPDVKLILVTRDKDGMSLIEPCTHVHLWEPTHATKIVDDVGAGDTVLAVMAISLSIGALLREAMHLASIAAGIVIGKPGTATVTKREIEAYLDAYQPKSVISKIATFEEALEIVAQWRREEPASTIGFTNGCFDLLHKGHLHVLTEGRRQGGCTKLIVAINSDSSVERLKGKGRPIQDFETRAAVLGALEMVNMVIVFEEESPLKIITGIQPDVLFKGGDYELEQIVGRSAVEKNGGRVFQVSYLQGHATTQVIKTRLSSNDFVS